MPHHQGKLTNKVYEGKVQIHMLSSSADLFTGYSDYVVTAFFANMWYFTYVYDSI